LDGWAIASRFTGFDYARQPTPNGAESTIAQTNGWPSAQVLPLVLLLIIDLRSFEASALQLLAVVAQLLTALYAPSMPKLYVLIFSKLGNILGFGYVLGLFIVDWRVYPGPR
jgi:hypothetical protein